MFQHVRKFTDQLLSLYVQNIVLLLQQLIYSRRPMIRFSIFTLTSVRAGRTGPTPIFEIDAFRIFRCRTLKSLLHYVTHHISEPSDFLIEV